MDPDGHSPLPFIGAAILAGSLNVTINAGVSLMTHQDYTWSDAGIDFAIGTTFGGVIYGVAASPVYAMLSAPSRMIIMGGLGATEAATTAAFKEKPFTRNDAFWAFTFAVGFAMLGEQSSDILMRMSNKELDNWANTMIKAGISRSEMQMTNKKIVNNLSLRLYHAQKSARLYGASKPRMLQAMTKYYISKHLQLNKSMYFSPNTAFFHQAVNLRAGGITLGIIAGDSEFAGLAGPYLPDFFSPYFDEVYPDLLR